MREHPKRSSDHKELLGDSGSKPFRRERLHAVEFFSPLTCTFVADDEEFGPCSVLDLSSRGFAFRQNEGTSHPQGSQFSNLTIHHGTDVLWEGNAICTYQTGPRVGARFSSGYLDLDVVRLRSRVQGEELSTAITQWTEEDSLSTSWRSAVAQLGNLLMIARKRLEYLESNDLVGIAANSAIEKAAIETLYAQWGPLWEQGIARAHALSQELPADKLEIARRYSERILVPQFYSSPVLRRAIEKPLGYAGDYLQMVYFNLDDYEGTTLYQRFCHHLLRASPFTHSARARQETIRAKVANVVDRGLPTKIIALAAGPVYELRWFLERTEPFTNPVDFILFDQDEEALVYAQKQLDLLLLQRPSLPVTITCVHTSVKQLMKPDSVEQGSFLLRTLGNADLIYSTGLLDYLPDKIARFLVDRVFQILAPGGELMLGNFREDPVSSWPLEYSLAWFLTYREEAEMDALAEGVRGPAESVEVRQDATGLCLFLNVRKPS